MKKSKGIINAYKDRRYQRLLNRMDDDEGSWITINGSHVHLNEAGDPDVGNAKVLSAIKDGPKGGGKSSGGGSKPAASKPTGQSAAITKADRFKKISSLNQAQQARIRKMMEGMPEKQIEKAMSGYVTDLEGKFNVYAPVSEPALEPETLSSSATQGGSPKIEKSKDDYLMAYAKQDWDKMESLEKDLKKSMSSSDWKEFREGALDEILYNPKYSEINKKATAKEEYRAALGEYGGESAGGQSESADERPRGFKSTLSADYLKSVFQDGSGKKGSNFNSKKGKQSVGKYLDKAEKGTAVNVGDKEYIKLGNGGSSWGIYKDGTKIAVGNTASVTTDVCNDLLKTKFNFKGEKLKDEIWWMSGK